ncbi:hypothetical protein WJX81_000065 [Elliptochloris bilobata]|uniref:Uncharacterized protein n=1 Tax=Elliptochloris bilobata TaxID=381761 RepID=A0AAW1QVS1_9CHLO
MPAATDQETLLEELEEAAALRAEAERTGDDKLAAEFRAVEARLRVLADQVRAEAAARSAATLRERLRHLQSVEARARAALLPAAPAPAELGSIGIPDAGNLGTPAELAGGGRAAVAASERHAAAGTAAMPAARGAPQRVLVLGRAGG